MHGMDGAHTMFSASVTLPSLRRFSFSSSSRDVLIATRFSRKSNGDEGCTIIVIGRFPAVSCCTSAVGSDFVGWREEEKNKKQNHDFIFEL